MSPSKGLWLSTNLWSARSAVLSPTVTAACAVSLSAYGSTWSVSPRLYALFRNVSSTVPESTFTHRRRVSEAPGARSPSVHIPASASTVPRVYVAFTTSTSPTSPASWIRTLVAVAGP